MRICSICPPVVTWCSHSNTTSCSYLVKLILTTL
nr:MAG TPA: hypothetical protein [Caudoviricetes sp.]